MMVIVKNDKCQSTNKSSRSFVGVINISLTQTLKCQKSGVADLMTIVITQSKTSNKVPDLSWNVYLVCSSAGFKLCTESVTKRVHSSFNKTQLLWILLRLYATIVSTKKVHIWIITGSSTQHNLVLVFPLQVHTSSLTDKNSTRQRPSCWHPLLHPQKKRNQNRNQRYVGENTIEIREEECKRVCHV